MRHKLKIKGKPRGVATLLAQSMIETEIAQELKIDQSTISRDSSLQQKPCEKENRRIIIITSK